MKPDKILSDKEIIFLESIVHIKLKDFYSDDDWVELIDNLQDEYLNFTDEDYNPDKNGLEVERIIDYLTDKVG